MSGPLALIGETPGFAAGRAGVELWAGMERFAHLQRGDFAIGTLLREGSAKKPKPEEIGAALPRFMETLERIGPELVVTIGGTVTRTLLGNVSMNQVHGLPHEGYLGGTSYLCFPMYHPGAGLQNKGFLAACAYDLKNLAGLLAGDVPVWAQGAPHVTRWLTDGASLPDVAPGTVVGLDTEGWKEQPWGLSFCVDGVVGYVIPYNHPVYLDSRFHPFSEWLKNKTVVMHNGLHDVPVLRAMGVNVTNFHDTQVLGYHDMLRTGSGVLEADAQNLGTLAYRECGMELGELTDCEGVDLEARIIPYTDEVMRYAGADPIACWRLFQRYKQRGIVDSQPYTIDMGQVALIEQMITNGIPFDADATMQYYTEVLDKLEAVTGELKAAAAEYGNREFNPGSHQQVRELVTRKIGLHIRKRTRGGKPSTNEKALADHKDHPFIQQLQTHRELVKLKGTYILPLLEALL